MRSDIYQIALIFLGIVSVAFFSVFVHRELFPEYKIYQDDYVALEKFRSSYTGESPPPFQREIKQIVLEREDRGPPVIDRCTSCHVALEVSAFSPTKIAHDVNGNIMRDAKGFPLQARNENYIWEKLDQRIKELKDREVIEQLQAQGDPDAVNQRLKEAKELEKLKTANVEGRVYDVTKVIAMHPLIGKETRPFEFHPVEEYGCTVCHNGNGRGLTTETAHGPIFDGQYEIEYTGPTPKFTESDPLNDPSFARMFNHQPGSDLIFQTTPLLLQPLMQAKCMQCHQSTPDELQKSIQASSTIIKRHERKVEAVKVSFENEKQVLITLLRIKKEIEDRGLEATLADIKQKAHDYTLPPDKQLEAKTQLKYLTAGRTSQSIQPMDQQIILENIDQHLNSILGSAILTKSLVDENNKKEQEEKALEPVVDKFLAEHRHEKTATGSLFVKAAEWDLEREMSKHVQDTETSLQATVDDQEFLTHATSDIDFLTTNFQHGRDLFLSQGCYACHRIAGFSRGGVGPELTRIGNDSPWYIKESIVWPQGKLKTSTMPNMRLDHEELSDLVNFLLAQKGGVKSIADTTHKIAIQEWEAGRKMPWEKPINPAEIHDLRYSMTVFATQGCAACHRLKGFESNIGYAVEKGKDGEADFDQLYQARQWFTQLFPEDSLGSQIVAAIDAHQSEIDQRIVENVRQGSLLEEIDKKFPEYIEALYSNFKFAMRAKNHYYAQLVNSETDPQKIAQILKERAQWQIRVKRILMMYIQEYGLGRLIGPRPNWSGVFRTDEWLMEHFLNPGEHVPNSIMPVFPFDDTKFYALTHMLDVLGKRNRDAETNVWRHIGFNPEQAVHIHCAQCHGELLIGNGPVSEWIYPVPKNLRNPDFLRNLTKERAIFSITHGVKGTPMPPWGEIAKDKPDLEGKPVLTQNEIEQIADWLFSSLAGGKTIPDESSVPKWQYQPKDVLEELHKEGNQLKGNLKTNEGEENDGKEVSLGLAIASNDDQKPVMPAKMQVGITPNPSGAVTDIFDVIPNPPENPDKENYFIKNKFYTQDNIARGKEFFDLNCAVCHGAEADGTGIRAEVMQSAKPRMLTNLDWIGSRDDLRLLRSIKYGVPGTGMTPWGDLTNSLQRLQLVVFIRSLSRERAKREQLSALLYQTFEPMQQLIENARAKEYLILSNFQEEYNQAQTQEKTLLKQIDTEKVFLDKATELYRQKLDAMEKLKLQRSIDALYVELNGQVQHERDLYEGVRNDLLSRSNNEASLQSYNEILALNEGRYTVNDGVLEMHIDPEHERKIATLSHSIENNFDLQITTLEKKRIIEEGKIASPERSQTIERLNSEIKAIAALRNKMLTDFEEAARTRKNQASLFKQLQEKLKK